jgi:hypothetical protein
MEQEEQVHKHRRENRQDEVTAVDQYRELADRLEKQNERWEADSKSKQKLIEELVERDTLCQIRIHKQWGWMTQANSWIVAANDRITWLSELARKEGHDVHVMVKPPELPPPPPEHDYAPSFHARSQAQNTEIIKAASPTLPLAQKPNGEP